MPKPTPNKKYKEPGKHDPRAPLASSAAVQRSMQGNRGKDTKPELLLRQALREVGLPGYRLHWPVPGRPDIAYPGRKVCVRVQGCYWHRCPHCQLQTPKTNSEFWAQKFGRNIARDERNEAALKELGWTVITAWECQIKKGSLAIASQIKTVIDDLITFTKYEHV